MHRNYSYNSTFKNNHSSSLCKITELRIVHEPYHVDEAITEIYKRCMHYPVIGMDCEWIPTTKKNQQPDVSLLQIATVDGFCVLIRTCFMTELPTSVLDLLSDRKIIKVGVGIFNDGKVLHHKFQNCQVVGKLDVRFLSRSCNVFSRSESLKELTKSLLNFELDKDNVLYFRWNERVLDEETATYAALDALAGVKIFEKLLPLYHEQMSEEPLLPPKKLIEKYFINIDDRRSLGARILDRKFNFEEQNELGNFPGFSRTENRFDLYHTMRDTSGLKRDSRMREYPVFERPQGYSLFDEYSRMREYFVSKGPEVSFRYNILRWSRDDLKWIVNCLVWN